MERRAESRGCQLSLGAWKASGMTAGYRSGAETGRPEAGQLERRPAPGEGLPLEVEGSACAWASDPAVPTPALGGAGQPFRASSSNSHRRHVQTI